MSTFTRFQKLRKKAPLAWLGHVFVGILALDDDARTEIGDRFNVALRDELQASGGGAFVSDRVEDFAEHLSDFLHLPQRMRPALVEKIDAILDDLEGEDCFGTEGQCDPRGDHRS